MLGSNCRNPEHYYYYFFVSGVGFPLYPEIFYFIYTMILQRIGIIVGDAGFEPVTLSII